MKPEQKRLLREDERETLISYGNERGYTLFAQRLIEEREARQKAETERDSARADRDERNNLRLKAEAERDTLAAIVKGQSADLTAITKAALDLMAERDALKERLHNEYRVSIGEVWHWQGDEHDHLDSLTCPILITPEKMKELQAELAGAQKDSDRNAALVDHLFEFHCCNCDISSGKS